MPQFSLPPPIFQNFNPQGPWNIGPGAHWPGMQMPNMPVENKEVPSNFTKPGEMDPSVIAKAAKLTEHRAPDDRPYYHHAADFTEDVNDLEYVHEQILQDTDWWGARTSHKVLVSATAAVNALGE